MFLQERKVNHVIKTYWHFKTLHGNHDRQPENAERIKMRFMSPQKGQIKKQGHVRRDELRMKTRKR